MRPAAGAARSSGSPSRELPLNQVGSPLRGHLAPLTRAVYWDGGKVTVRRSGPRARAGPATRRSRRGGNVWSSRPEFRGTSGDPGGLQATVTSAPTVKQHLAAIRGLFDWLVTGHVLETNPAHSVRGPKHVVTRGKTSVLTADQARELLDSIDTSTIVGLCDRAFIAVMVYSFARVSAVARMQVGDYYQDGKRWWLRLHEKGGKLHQVPAHHNAEAYLDAYLEAAGLEDQKKEPLFRTVNKARQLTTTPMSRHDVFRMIRRRAKAAGLPATVCCHTFRATGITTYLENGGTIENAQAIAAHASPRTTKLYDRTSDEITLDEVERIRI